MSTYEIAILRLDGVGMKAELVWRTIERSRRDMK